MLKNLGLRRSKGPEEGGVSPQGLDDLWSEDAAQRDQLTGLYNQDYLLERLEWEVRRSERLRAPFSLIFVALDSFAAFNARFGKSTGDMALKELGRFIHSRSRIGDVVVHYGADEFAVFLPDTRPQAASALAKRIISGLPKARLVTVPGEDYRFTASCGIASWPLAGREPEELVTIGHDALLLAKEAGGNCLKVLPDYGVSGQEEPGAASPIELLLKREELGIIGTLVEVIEARDPFLHGCAERVAYYADRLAEQLSLGRDERRTLQNAALLHDIGMIGVPDTVLQKTGPLSEEETELVKEHPSLGVRIIKGTPSLSPCVPIVLHHHERYDGKGYPEGLVGEAIPYLARVLATADAFVALTSPRSYRSAKTKEEAVEEILRNVGTQFDPQIAEALAAVVQSEAS